MYKKLKILQIIPEFKLAGAEIMAENLTGAFLDMGFKISVVSLYDFKSAITERFEKNNTPIFYLNKKKGFDIKLIIRLYKLLINEKPDVIHTHLYIMPYVVPAAILAKVPVKVHTIHNIAKKEVGWLQRCINLFFYKYCNVIPVSISPLVKNSVIQEYKIPDDKVPMIYNGIDLNKCIPKNKYIKNRIRILHIGRFSEQKNHLGLIESFKNVVNKAPNTVLQLIGTGHLEKVIKDKVRELGLEENVEFLGIQTNVYPYLNEADIFVLPSLWEGMPISLIEAMATGLPCVVTKVGGIPDMVVDNVTGIIVDINEKQIADALIKLINDCSLREKLGKAALIVAQQYSSQEMARQYALVYKKNK
jgi:glycosyltransferase involved in cell wall biosynthesis